MIHILSILPGQAKTLHIPFDTISPSLPLLAAYTWTCSSSWLAWSKGKQPLGAVWYSSQEPSKLPPYTTSLLLVKARFNYRRENANKTQCIQLKHVLKSSYHIIIIPYHIISYHIADHKQQNRLKVGTEKSKLKVKMQSVCSGNRTR